MTLTGEITRWTHEQHCRKAVAALTRNGFTALYCASSEEARDYVLKAAEGAASVGFGGSRTIIDLGVEEIFRAAGKEILNHAQPGLGPEEKLAVMRRELLSDLFLASSNALTLDGHLVNIDGNGNRAAAMIFGPGKVVLVVGRNKLVAGDDQAALRRIGALAAPANTRRLGRRTPCAETGLCSDCNSPERICRATTILSRRPGSTDIHVLVVNEELGF